MSLESVQSPRAKGKGNPYLIWIRNVDGGHVKTAFVESRSLAELLDNLHHYSLRQPVTKRQKSGGTEYSF